MASERKTLGVNATSTDNLGQVIGGSSYRFCCRGLRGSSSKGERDSQLRHVDLVRGRRCGDKYWRWSWRITKHSPLPGPIDFSVFDSFGCNPSVQTTAHSESCYHRQSTTVSGFFSLTTISSSISRCLGVYRTSLTLTSSPYTAPELSA